MRPQTLLITRCYKKGVTFSKTKAAALLGSRRKLEDLVAKGDIRMEKPTLTQNGKWQVSAGDVLFQILKD